MRLILVIASTIFATLLLVACGDSGYQNSSEEQTSATYDDQGQDQLPRRRILHRQTYSQGGMTEGRRMVGGERRVSAPREPRPTNRGLRPQFNCEEAGGQRTINPRTGKRSCFIPDEVQD